MLDVQQRHCGKHLIRDIHRLPGISVVKDYRELFAPVAREDVG